MGFIVAKCTRDNKIIKIMEAYSDEDYKIGSRYFDDYIEEHRGEYAFIVIDNAFKKRAFYDECNYSRSNYDIVFKQVGDNICS